MALGSGSEIRDPEKTYSGSRIQGSKRHRIPDPDPQHCNVGNPGSDAFLTLGSGIRDGKKIRIRNRIRDEQPGSYFRELKNNFWR